jgi:hypothetical protein
MKKHSKIYIWTGDYFARNCKDPWVYVRDVNEVTGMVEYQEAFIRAPWQFMHIKDFDKKYYRNNEGDSGYND